MDKLIKNVKITLSPFTTNVETAGHLTISVFGEYGTDKVTLSLNPNILDYQETGVNSGKGVQIKQVMVTQPTAGSKSVRLTLKEPTAKVNMGSASYELKLLNITKENLQGQDFLSFELLVTEL